jgi:uncharacterized protein (TIGR02001 family)
MARGHSAAALSLLALLAAPAEAEWSGHVDLSSNAIERGVTQSDGQASASAGLQWTHAIGARASLAASTVSDHQFSQSDGYKLSPEIGWERHFGNGWRHDIALRGQIFPGAHGTWYGSLPPRAQARVQQPQETDYGTAELAVSLGWRWVTLSWTRSLTDYLGASAVETEGTGAAARQTLLESTGTRYLAVELAWPATDALTLNAGIGRLTVPNFDALNYTDWRLGVTWLAAGLHWGLQASGTNASADAYRRRSSDHNNASQSVTASVGWAF